MATAKVQMFDPVANKAIEVDAARVPDAEAEGLTVETQDSAAQRAYQEHAGLGQAALAGLEGTLSGLTFGLSDVAAAGVGGEEYTQSRRLRDETFGAVHGLGELAGMAVPALLSGGSSTAARVAARTPAGLLARASAAAERGAANLIARTGITGAERGVLRTALARAAGVGAAGALEGAAYGAGQGLSEAAIADQLGGIDDAAEFAWAGAKQGALFGGAVGLGIGAGTSLLGSAGRGLAKRFRPADDELAGAANARALKAIDPTYAEARKLGSDAKRAQIGEDLRTYVLRDGRHVIEAGDSVSEVAPKLKAARHEVARELGEIRRQVADAGAKVDARRFLERAHNEVITDLLTNPSPTLQRLGKRTAAEIKALSDEVKAAMTPRGQGGRFQKRSPDAGLIPYADVLKQQRALKAIAYPERPKGLGLSPTPVAWAGYISKLERILEEELEGTVEKAVAAVAPENLGRYQAARRLTESFSKAEKIAEKSLGHAAGNRFFSLTDYLSGLTAAGAIFDGGMSAVGGVAAAAAHKAARERGSATLAALYTRGRELSGRIESTIAQVFHGRTPRPIRVPEALKRVPEAATKARRSAVGAGAGVAAGLSVRDMLGAQADETEHDAYQRVLAAASSIRSGGVQELNVDESAPNVGHAMRSLQVRAAEHLLRNAPSPQVRSSNPNLARMQGFQKADPVSMHAFAKRVRTIENPLSVLEDLRADRISMPSVEALREVYPKLYQRMRATVLDRIAEESESMPYELRIKLGLLFDLPTDPTLDPAAIRAMQAVYVTAPPANTGATPAKTTRADRIRSGSDTILLEE